MSRDPEQEYFSDGISEDIITDLSKVSALFVIARNSAFVYKGKAFNIPDICRELDVRFALEGSVRKAGNRVRITAQLIDGSRGGHLWAERYDRDLTDIFAVQDDVTQQIVAALKVTLSEAEKSLIADSGTTNVDAHDFFLRGRELIWGVKEIMRCSINRPSASGAPLSSIRTMAHPTRAWAWRTYWIISTTGATRPRSHSTKPSIWSASRSRKTTRTLSPITSPP
jgi:TolB-like protein